MMLYLPRYASPKREGRIPPSPPAERRNAYRRLIAKEMRYPVSGRVLLPGMPYYEETLRAMPIGQRGAMTGGMQSLSGVETQLLSAVASGPSVAPTHFYRMETTSWSDTGSGTALDLSAVASSPTVNTGKVGVNAAYFDGSVPQNLTRADHTDFEMGTVDYTIWFWFWVNDLSAVRGIAAKGDNFFSNTEWSIQTNATPTALLQISVTSDGNMAGGTSRTASTFGNLSNNTWYFGCVRRHAATDIQISVNAGTFDSTNFASNIFTGTSPLYLATRGFNGGSPLSPLTGRIDALAFFKGTAMSAADVTLGYNGGAGMEYYAGSWH